MSVCSSDSSEVDRLCSERTLAIIKPEAYENAEDIENHIRDNGFIILARREVRLSPEEAAELYRGHYGRLHFPHLVAQMSSGPIVALVLAASGCIQKWQTLIGPAKVMEAQAYWPDSLRACYGRRSKHGDYFNGLHGSENLAEAYREIHFFFPTKVEAASKFEDLGWIYMRPPDRADCHLHPFNACDLTSRCSESGHINQFNPDLVVVGPILRKWQISDYTHKYLAPTLGPALTELAHNRPAEPILWLAEKLRGSNPNEPRMEKTSNVKCHTPEPSEGSCDCPQ